MMKDLGILTDEKEYTEGGNHILKYKLNTELYLKLRIQKGP